MSRFRCKPFVGGHVLPASAGSAIGGPRDWSVTDDGSVAGDILRLDVSAPPPPVPGYRLTHYELALSQRGGSTEIRRVLGGPAPDYSRRFRTASPRTPQRAQLRAVWQELNQMRWNAAEEYEPTLNDAASQPTTEATAVVSARVDNGDGTWTVTLDNIAAPFVAGEITILRGRPGETQSVTGNEIVWRSYRVYDPQPGDTLTQLNGARATLKKKLPISAGAGLHYLVLEDISGLFEDQQITFVNGNAGVQGSALHCTHDDAVRVTLKSEWSLPRDVLPETGTPQVSLIASRTTCLQGEAVIFEATATGFQCERPIHELRYRFFVDKPGEQGVHAALPAFFDSCFGTGASTRTEGYAQVWAFAPRTTGTVTVRCEVTDREGNTATAALDITAEAPATVFDEADVYAASAALTPVPGVPGARLFSTFEELEAALPNGETRGLVLLDTNDLHGAGQFDHFNIKDKVKTHCALMPYNASGVGPAAGARAAMNRGITYEGARLTTFGINLVGPFVPEDPFSVSVHPEHGFNCDQVGYNAIAECDITGWRENVKLPLPGNRGAYFDVLNTDYHNFGWFGGDVGRHAFAGVNTFTNPRSWRASGKSSASDNADDGFFVDHGPYRSSRPDGARGFSKCVFFSCCSWGGTGYPQNPVRLYGNGATDRPMISHGAEIITEGGALSIDATTRGGGDTTAHPQDFVWDKFFHITSMQPLSAMAVGMGGVTLRNGVIVTSSNPYEVNGSGVRHHLGFSNENSVPGQNDSENNPIDISFLSVVDLRVDSGQSTQQLVLSSSNAEFPMKNVNIENVLTYAPNFTSSDIGAAPLDTTPRWTPLYAGQYFWDPTITGTNAERLAGQSPDLSFATPPEVTASFMPAPGSNAYGTAAGAVPYDDIRSRVRPSQGASRGAYDPNAT
ncbi:hypothetical protein [uncultured Roseobacter sp.]|uniref:hypothetical protein n=1 Tax=uncultured Roseobacter sp. TaxID=114847 RepID=UPI00261810E5|nr:hypothetical protein [uncultured Roseobacter sp.]